MEAVGLLVVVVVVVIIVRAAVAAGSGSSRPSLVLLGYRPGWWGGLGTPVTIPRTLRLRSLWVVGPTGAGKSTTLKLLMLQDARDGYGFVCVDIKDDLVLDVAARLPRERIKDVVLIDLADRGFPIAWNPLADVPEAWRSLVAAELLGAFKRLYAEHWGPRLEYVLRMCLLTLLRVPGSTLLDIRRLLIDDAYRAFAVTFVASDDTLHTFWQREFPAIVSGRSLANVESILNKLGILSVYPELANIFGQREGRLDINDAPLHDKIVLVNAPQGLLGEEVAFFVAALFVGMVQVAAQRRVRLASSQRRPFYLFLDEAQNYSTSALNKLVTECRSMAVGCVVANQFEEQLPRDVRLSLERNVAYKLKAQLRYQSQRELELENPNEPPPPPGYPEPAPFVFLPVPFERYPIQPGQLAAIRAQSRQLLARPRLVVEAERARSDGDPGTRPVVRVVRSQPIPDRGGRDAASEQPRVRRVERGSQEEGRGVYFEG
jgi:hypothetical protein